MSGAAEFSCYCGAVHACPELQRFFIFLFCLQLWSDFACWELALEEARKRQIRFVVDEVARGG
jgi:hypothetical protein